VNAVTQLRFDSPGSIDPALLFAAINALPQSLAVVDSGNVLYVNLAWAQMFEYADPSQVRGRRLDDVVPGHSFHTPLVSRNDASRNDVARNDTGRNDTSGIDRETVCASREFMLHRRDGTQEQVQVFCSGFRVRGKEFQVLSAGAARPPKAETEMRETQSLEAVGRLTGGVAHDFNNLLTGIMLYCDLLIAELEEDSRSHHYAQEIRRAGQHGAKVVQQLLAVARPQALESRVFALNEVVTGIEELLTRLIGENIVLTTLLAGDLGVVRMDPAHVQQILLNFVLNARDAMPEGGHITIATQNCANSLTDMEQGSRGGERDDETQRLLPCVELAVIDTGCGMDGATLGRAFEPFFTTKKPGRGNGLGLATACRLAKLEGGTIVAESQPGKGTRVSLLLPRVVMESDVDPASSDAEGLIANESHANVPTQNVPVLKAQFESRKVIHYDNRRAQHSCPRSD
jgi:signal transduction histidine kinase